MNNDITVNNTENTARATKKKLFVLFAAVIAASFIAAVLYCLSFLLNYDREYCYFTGGAVLPVLSKIFLIICVVIPPVLCFKIRPEDLPQSLEVGGGAGGFICLYAAFISLFEGFCRARMVYLRRDEFSTYFDRTSASYESFRLYRISLIVDIITVALCIGCAFYFASLYRRGFRANEKGSLLGLFPATRALIGIAQLYFDIRLALNSPVKLVAQFALIIITLYFLTETRYSLPLKYARPRYFIAFSLSSLVAAAAAGFSLLLLYFTNNGYYSSTILANSFGEVCFEAFFCVNAFVYILIRFAAFMRSIGAVKKQEENEEKTGTENEAADAEAGNVNDSETENTADNTETEENTEQTDGEIK